MKEVTVPTLAKVLVVTGVCCSGKSTLGAEVSRRLMVDFYDGDDFHSPASVRKMSEGVPLRDEDRREWLGKINELVVSKVEAKGSAVIACSALKAKYRSWVQSRLSATQRKECVLFVHLSASEDLIAERLAKRRGHFMPASLLASQFEALEEPAGEEEGISLLLLDASQTTEENTNWILQHLSPIPA